MKTYKLGQITYADLWAGFESWASRPSGRKNLHRIEREYGSASALIDEIASELSSRSLTFRSIRRYEHVEHTNGKVRVIGIESVKQQVCDHIACRKLEPLIDARLGFYQVAAVKGKGQSLCRSALKTWVREGGYHVKLDVRKCYPSTSPEVVMGILRRYVRSSDVLYMADALMSTYDGGLEIGSYFSLRMMQLVLSFGYHHVEGLGKERRGRWVPLVSHQIWHLDDALLMSRDKRDLKMAVRSLVRYMRDELGLEIKPWKVCKVGDAEPLDLGGWVVREGRCTLRAGTFLRGTRAFRRFERHPTTRNAASCCSYWGWFKHGDCMGVRRRRHIDGTLAHARRVVSAHCRLESAHGTDIQRDPA